MIKTAFVLMFLGTATASADPAGCLATKNAYLDRIAGAAQDQLAANLAPEFTRNHGLLLDLLKDIETDAVPADLVPVVRKDKSFALELKENLASARKGLKLYSSMTDDQVKPLLGANIYGVDVDNDFRSAVADPVDNALRLLRDTYSSTSHACPDGAVHVQDNEYDCKDLKTGQLVKPLGDVTIFAGFRIPSMSDQIQIGSFASNDPNPSVPFTIQASQTATSDHFEIHVCREVPASKAGVMTVEGVSIDLMGNHGPWDEGTTSVCSTLDLRTGQFTDEPPARSRLLVLTSMKPKLVEFVARSRDFQPACPAPVEPVRPAAPAPVQAQQAPAAPAQQPAL